MSNDDTRSPRDSEGEVTGQQPPTKPTNRREFELALRRMLGFSKREAKFIAACGYSEGLAQAGGSDDVSDRLALLLKRALVELDRKDME